MTEEKKWPGEQLGKEMKVLVQPDEHESPTLPTSETAIKGWPGEQPGKGVSSDMEPVLPENPAPPEPIILPPTRRQPRVQRGVRW